MATEPTKRQLIEAIPLFSGLRDKELGRVATLADELRVDAGTELVREGTPGNECFVIATGRATVTVDGRNVGTLGPGELFGEMTLLDRAPRSATVVADEAMHLLVFDPRSFALLLEELPTVNRKVMASLAHRLRAADKSPEW